MDKKTEEQSQGLKELEELLKNKTKNEEIQEIEQIVDDSMEEIQAQEENIQVSKETIEEYEKMEKMKPEKEEKEQISNNKIYIEALSNRKHILDLIEKYNAFDSFVTKGWKLIATIAVSSLIIGYTISTYHHDSFLKPMINDLAEIIIKKIGS